MPDRLFRLYQRKRVININANIIAAGLISTLIVGGAIWIMKAYFGVRWPTWGYTTFSLAADIVLDVAIFAGLHWIANHWRPLRGRSEKERAELEADAPHHVRDAAQIQLERAVISPLYYLIAVVGTESLQQAGLHPTWAVFIAFPGGLAVTRVIHTLWGLRSGTYVDHHHREGNGTNGTTGRGVDGKAPDRAA